MFLKAINNIIHNAPHHQNYIKLYRKGGNYTENVKLPLH